MVYKYTPEGVCSKEFIIDIDENHIINDIKIIGGCPGNLLGISKIIKGMKAEEVIEKFKGVRCGGKLTSCPDQISAALIKIINNKL